MPDGNPGRMEEGQIPTVLVQSPSADNPPPIDTSSYPLPPDIPSYEAEIGGEVEHHWIPRSVLRWIVWAWEWITDMYATCVSAVRSMKPLDDAGTFVTTFDRVSLVFQFANLIFIPMALAWTCEMLSPLILALFYLSDVVGLMDCFIDMMRSYRDDFGLLVTDFAQIRNEYLMKRRGWLSIVTTIPWDAIPLIHESVINDSVCHHIGVFDAYRLWAVLRLLRFVPMSKLLNFLITVKLSMLHMTVSRLGKNVFLIVVVSHISACAFWFLSSMDDDTKSWIHLNKLGYHSVYDSISPENLTVATRYLRSLFAAQKAVFFVFRDVETIPERVYCLIVVIDGLSSNQGFRYMDSSEEEQELAEHHKRRIKQLQKYMQQKHLDLSFQQSVVLALRPLTVLPGWCVFREGDDASEMYFIKSGAVEVFKDTKVFVTLGEGKFFGEIALMENIKRTASIRAIAQTELAVLTREDFDAILASRPSIREQIVKYVEEKKEQDKKRRAELERETEEKRKREQEEEERKMAQAKAFKSKNVISSRVIMSKASIASRSRLHLESAMFKHPCWCSLAEDVRGHKWLFSAIISSFRAES
ncbi:hypothetical protein M427DRAFT_65314 [Gonapodya prolifera JEL478]|uniref:Cyclic nucleotide-binding domain-containing protein n=1 Tax=Gonapodya prolifera (strain JEL478) TaxID=1344416 RepID=A0A139AZY2_GONPJ|nr:hypothetical protein M427DRAFT_65314 [Gonapodya prolifera JEL478]|eukprot:KXS22302.1 hypothetical protein M427DRAFT_65314 [Gonapodya prolifera JEL478]